MLAEEEQTNENQRTAMNSTDRVKNETQKKNNTTHGATEKKTYGSWSTPKFVGNYWFSWEICRGRKNEGHKKA